jgi:hypothetical protein
MGIGFAKFKNDEFDTIEYIGVDVDKSFMESPQNNDLNEAKDEINKMDFNTMKQNRLAFISSLINAIKLSGGLIKLKFDLRKIVQLIKKYQINVTVDEKIIMDHIEHDTPLLKGDSKKDFAGIFTLFLLVLGFPTIFLFDKSEYDKSIIDLKKNIIPKYLTFYVAKGWFNNYYEKIISTYGSLIPIAYQKQEFKEGYNTLITIFRTINSMENPEIRAANMIGIMIRSLLHSIKLESITNSTDMKNYFTKHVLEDFLKHILNGQQCSAIKDHDIITAHDDMCKNERTCETCVTPTVCEKCVTPTACEKPKKYSILNGITLSMGIIIIILIVIIILIIIVRSKK